MERMQIDCAAAFQYVCRVSSHNTKVIHIAEELVRTRTLPAVS